MLALPLHAGGDVIQSFRINTQQIHKPRRWVQQDSSQVYRGVFLGGRDPPNLAMAQAKVRTKVVPLRLLPQPNLLTH